MKQLQLYWKTYPLLRWAVLHWLSWPLGLFMAALLLQVAGFLGLLLAGSVVGAVVGAAQSWLLYENMEERRRWIFYSALGGLFGSFPAYVFAFLSIFSWGIAALLVGLSFGGGLGAMQALAMFQAEKAGYWHWFGVTLGAAVAGTWLAALGIVFGWPILLSPSGILFGLALGYLWEKRFAGSLSAGQHFSEKQKKH